MCIRDSLSPPGYNLSLKPKLENSKDELLKKVWIFTLHVLLIRKENRTMCNEKNHRDVYVTANMPPIEDIVIWTANPRQKSLKHLCTSLFLCIFEMWLQSYLATTAWRGKTKGSSFPKCFKGFVWDCSLIPVTSTSLLWLMMSGSAPGLVKVHRICKGFFLRPTWSLRSCVASIFARLVPRLSATVISVNRIAYESVVVEKKRKP